MPTRDDADTDEERDDDDDDTEIEEQALPEVVTEIPRARRRAPAKPPAIPTPFGTIPIDASCWTIKKRSQIGGWEPLSHPSLDGTMALSEWPLPELTEANVRARWGEGVYRIGWFGSNDRGGRRFLAQGRIFTILPMPQQQQAPLAAPPPVVSLGPGFDQAMAIMSVVESKTNQNLTSIAQLATALAGRQSGPDPAVMMLQQQLEQMRAQQAEARYAALENEIRSLRASLAEVEEVDDEPSAAKPAKPPMRPGDSAWETIKANVINAAIQNPDKALAFLGGLAESVAKMQPKPPPPPPPPQQAPPELRARPIAKAKPAPQQPQGPGLNGYTQSKAQAAPASSGPGLNGYVPEVLPPVAAPPPPPEVLPSQE